MAGRRRRPWKNFRATKRFRTRSYENDFQEFAKAIDPSSVQGRGRIVEFKFKIQPFQTEAAKAVTDVFEGQPNQGAFAYCSRPWAGAVPPISSIPPRAMEMRPVLLDAGQLLANIRSVQSGNQIMESSSLCADIGARANLTWRWRPARARPTVYTKTAY